MNYRDIVRTANANLLRSKVRTLLTVISIFVGAFTIALTVGITSGVSTYIDKQLGNIGAENVLIVQPKIDTSMDNAPKEYNPEKNTHSTSGPLQIPMLSSEDLTKIEQQPGIELAEPVRTAQIDYMVYENGKKLEINLGSYVTDTQIELEAGRLPNNDSSGYEIIIPTSYTEPLGLGSSENAINKTVDLSTTNSVSGKSSFVGATIVGIMSPSLIATEGANGNSALMIKIDDISKEGLPDNLRYSFMAVAASVSENSSQEEIDSIKNALDEKGFTAQTIQDQIGILNQVIDAITAVLVFFGAIALLAASFGIINTLYMAVQERTKEIGLMKAMGMRKSRVFALFSVEAALIGFWGSLLGILAAIGVGRIANRVASNSFLKDLAGFNLTEFPASSLVAIILIVMVIAFISGTLPARRAAKQDPISALRYE